MELRTQTQEIEAEVFLFAHRIGGKIVCPQNQRLSDFLQSGTEFLVMNEVSVRTGGGEMLGRCEALNLLKEAICFIAPNESSEQLANRRAVRFGIATPATSRLPVRLLLDRHTLNGQLSSRGATTALPLIASLPAFFPLQDAEALFEDGSLLRSDLYLVNAGRVVALGSPKD